MKMIPPDEFGNEVAQYDSITLVHMCAEKWTRPTKLYEREHLTVRK